MESPREQPLSARFEELLSIVENSFDVLDDDLDYETRETLAVNKMRRCWRAAKKIRQAMAGEVTELTKEVGTWPLL